MKCSLKDFKPSCVLRYAAMLFLDHSDFLHYILPASVFLFVVSWAFKLDTAWNAYYPPETLYLPLGWFNWTLPSIRMELKSICTLPHCRLMNVLLFSDCFVTLSSLFSTDNSFIDLLWSMFWSWMDSFISQYHNKPQNFISGVCHIYVFNEFMRRMPLAVSFFFIITIRLAHILINTWLHIILNGSSNFLKGTLIKNQR